MIGWFACGSGESDTSPGTGNVESDSGVEVVINDVIGLDD
jgi:hypothetical protein